MIENKFPEFVKDIDKFIRTTGIKYKVSSETISGSQVYTYKLFYETDGYVEHVLRLTFVDDADTVQIHINDGQTNEYVYIGIEPKNKFLDCFKDNYLVINNLIDALIKL